MLEEITGTEIQGKVAGLESNPHERAGDAANNRARAKLHLWRNQQHPTAHPNKIYTYLYTYFRYLLAGIPFFPQIISPAEKRWAKVLLEAGALIFHPCLCSPWPGKVSSACQQQDNQHQSIHLKICKHQVLPSPKTPGSPPGQVTTTPAPLVATGGCNRRGCRGQGHWGVLLHGHVAPRGP